MGIKTAAIISFTLILVGLFKLYQFLSLPPYEKVILINRQHDIKIYRDKFGIPHI
jgi:acyl-homoserine lactone acylase PvdQ